MKKCSKSAHTALNELNITPLLDLAFVLLVIFVLTTTPITNDMPLDLPRAHVRPKQAAAKIHFVTVDAQGNYFLDRAAVAFNALRDRVAELRADDAEVNIVVRGDAKAPYKGVRDALDTIQRSGVAKVRLATEAYIAGAN